MLQARERVKRGRPTKEKLTLTGDLLQALRAQIEESAHVRFPSPRYRDDPVAFFREILGVEPWHKQVEILEAVRDHPRVAVSSGHKIGKSNSAAGVALWFYCSYTDARVVMTSVTDRQVNQILWRELRMMRTRGGRCVACKAAIKTMIASGMSQVEAESRIPRPCEHSALIEGHHGELARTGLKSEDFREIVGFTAREAEAVAGVSGENLLYLLDEASGISKEIFEAIEGNRAGGARLVMYSNPTKNDGEFFDAFHSKKDLYTTIRVSSEETPNVTEGRIVVPGLATREWVEEKKIEWGVDSPLYKVRVRGEHALNEDGKIFSIHAISQSEQRWEDASAEGRLFIGMDPAGASGQGDETAFAVRRGLKHLRLQTMRGLSEEAHLVQLLALINEMRDGREVPVVVMDREGDVGTKVATALRTFVDSPAGRSAFELVTVRASDKALRRPDVYDRQRDALVGNLEAWIREGGAILEDAKLSAEMHVFEWRLSAGNGRQKCTPKDVVRKALGRSPDRFDALALSVWEPLSLQGSSGTETPSAQQPTEHPGAPAIDPYAGADAFRPR